MGMARIAQRSRADWVDAAFARFNSGGLAAINVEQIAREIGTSKGSFYWHFSNRKELVISVVERWEISETDELISAAQIAGMAARVRLAELFSQVARRYGSRDGEIDIYREAVVEGVTEAVRRVSERRVQYVAGLLIELGARPAEAERRALLSLAAVIGMQQLAAVRVVPSSSNEEIVATALAMATAAP